MGKMPFRAAATLVAALAAAATLLAEEPGMEELKARVANQLGGRVPVQWGETVEGVRTRFDTDRPAVALTFDACGSAHDGYDAALIDFLRKERIPATLFVTGKWIEKNPDAFAELARDPLFEIENHGGNHRPCSVTGRSAYGIAGTADIAGVVDEVEPNARRIRALTGRKPLFYRCGTAFYDEVAVEAVNRLGYRVAGFSVLGDAGCTYSREQVSAALGAARPGDVILLHMNHPEKHTAEGVRDAIPELRKRGIIFVRLDETSLQ